MSTTYNNQQPRLGLRSRLWLGLRTIVTSRRRLFASRSSRQSRRLGRKRNTKSPKRQPGARATTSNMTTTATTTSAIPMTSTTLFADDGKTTPSEWFPIYQGCVEHFVNVAQHRPIAQSLAAHVNILLPSQRATNTGLQFSESSTTNSQSQSGSMAQQRSDPESGSSSFSLVPYIRRLVVTATDTPAVMQELFGEEWRKGVGAIHSQERMNYLFSAKSGGWLKTKAQYDILPYETVPFLRPLRDPQEEELKVAETQWSQWLAMEDWMVGPRSPFEDLSGN